MTSIFFWSPDHFSRKGVLETLHHCVGEPEVASAVRKNLPLVPRSLASAAEGRGVISLPIRALQAQAPRIL